MQALSVGEGLRRVYMWDTNVESGNGGPASEPRWRLNEHLVGRDVVQLSGASFFNVALDARGEVHCWGTPNQEHSFEFARSRKPKLLKGVGDGVTKVAAGDDRLLLVTSKGDVMQWTDCDFEPSLLPELGGLRVVQIACGEAHALACVESGALYAWGKGEEGQLGTGDFADTDTPEHISLDEGVLVASVSAAGQVSFVLTADGRVLSCGNDDSAQLGHGPVNGPVKAAEASADLEELEIDMEKVCVFNPVKLPKSVDRITHVACGASHGAAISDDGRVISWGSPDDGRLGRPPVARATFESHRLPQVIRDLSDKDISQIVASSGHTVGFTSTGGMWLWGKVGPELYPRPVKVGGEALADAVFLHGSATEWFTLAVAAVPSPGGTGDENDDG